MEFLFSITDVHEGDRPQEDSVLLASRLVSPGVANYCVRMPFLFLVIASVGAVMWCIRGDRQIEGETETARESEAEVGDGVLVSGGRTDSVLSGR